MKLFLRLLACAVVLLIAFVIWVFTNLYHNDYYTNHTAILKKSNYLEKRMGVTFPSTVKFQFLYSWGGLRDEGEMLKFFLPSSDVDSLLKSLQADPISRDDYPRLKWSVEKHPDWDLPTLKEGRTVSGPLIRKPGRTFLIVSPANLTESTVYACFRIDTD